MAKNEYLDNAVGAVGGMVGGIYAWSVLDMIKDVSHTGKYYLPWTSKWTGTFGAPGIPSALAGSGRLAEKVGLGRSVAGMMGRLPRMQSRGISRLGYTQLAVSKAVGVGFEIMAWKNPLWWAFTYVPRIIAKPATGLWAIPLALADFVVLGIGQKSARGIQANRYVNLGGGYFPDSQSAFTSRQRAVRAISESQLQARSAIGNEAQLFHR